MPATWPTVTIAWREKLRKNARRPTSWSGAGELSPSGSVLDDAVDRVSIEAFATLEEQQPHQERETDDLGLELLDQVDRSEHGAAGREQIVHDQHALPGQD